VEYDLGDAVIIQDWFAEDRFVRGMPLREMPVRLNGLIAVPEGEGGPYPVVVILHGTHAGCPTDPQGMVDFWPCDPAVEQPNYRGFDYLVQQLAAEGYVALSLNINAVNTFGYGEASGEDQVGSRISQLVAKHLAALAEAAAGGENNFGVDLAGRADMERLAFAGHSRGGEFANWYARVQGGFGGPGGPVDGLLLIAPAVSVFKPVPAGVPIAVILPACDGDVIDQDGQLFYEAIRLDPEAEEPATAAWLEAANHNNVRTLSNEDVVTIRDRPGCVPLMEPQVQQEFLVRYATDFLSTIFSSDPQAVAAARARLGLDETAAAPGDFYGLPGRVQSLVAAADRLTLLVPAAEEELALNRLGGAVTAEKAAIDFCPAGFFRAGDFPGAEICRRQVVTVPGNPATAVVSWEEPGAALRLALPEGGGDLSAYQALTLRAAVDPMTPLNAAGEAQAFTARLTDAAGNSAAVATRPDEPALQYPAGLVMEEGFFNGRAPLTAIRIPLEQFAGVDLTAVTEIALLFDQTPSGTLFLGDIELVQPPEGSERRPRRPLRSDAVGREQCPVTSGAGRNRAFWKNSV
jgi:dienelactone hydrolase